MSTRRASGILALLAIAQLSLGSVGFACTSTHESADNHAPSLASAAPSAILPGESDSPNQGSCHEEAANALPEHGLPCGGGDMSGTCLTAPSCVSAMAHCGVPAEERLVSGDAVAVGTTATPPSATSGPESPPPRA